jgi:hypothetical protein
VVPTQVGLVAGRLHHRNTVLHDQLLTCPTALTKAAQGTKALIAYANSIIARARDSSSSRAPGSSKLRQQTAAAILSRKVYPSPGIMW